MNGIFVQKEKNKDMDTNRENKERNSLKDYFSFGEVFGYFFRGKTEKKPNFNIRMMHGINKISIIAFLVAFIIWIIRRLV